MANLSTWRDTSRTPRFYGVDSRACYPLLIFLLHIRWWSFIIAVSVTLFFATLERYGFQWAVFVRWLRNLISGPRKSAKSWWIS